MADTIINGVVVKGKSYQFSTPGLEETKKRTITNLIDPSKYIITTSITQNGVTVTNNGDGTFTVNGTTDDNVGIDGKIAVNLFSWGSNVVIADGVSQVRLCGVPSDMENKALLQLADANDTTAWLADKGSGTTINTKDNKLTVYALRFEFYPNTTLDNVVFKPMITTDLYASYDEFVQYSGDGELNENVAKHEKDIKGLRNSFSQALTDLKATPIAQAVGAVGTTFASVIAKLGEIVDRKNWSANMDSSGSVTIPAGYHDGTGTVKTNGTASVTSNGTHNVAQYSSVTVNVQNDVKHSVVPYMKITQDSYRHSLVGLIVDGVDRGAVEVGTYGSQQNLQYNGSTYSV